MSNEPKPKNSSNSSLTSKSAQQKRNAEIAAQRKRTQQLLLLGAAVVGLIAVVIVILTASRPQAQATVDVTAINNRLAGLQTGTTEVNATYPIKFPTLGDPNAPVRLEEISSFACPVCLTYRNSVITNLLDKIKAGELYYVYLPTSRTGDYAPATIVMVTQAAYCAMEQDKFWPMEELLFNLQEQFANGVTRDQVLSGAEKLGIDIGKLGACMDKSESRKYVDASDEYVSNVRGMTGTPTVFLYVNNEQLKPANPDARSAPNNMTGLPLNEIRGIIESAAAARAASAAATGAATTAPTAAPTGATTVEPTKAS